MGAFTWTFLHFLYTGKWSLAALVSGAICGLVGITPGCGYMGMPASLLVGTVTSATCYYADKLRHCSLAKRYNIVDPAGVFVSHCLGCVELRLSPFTFFPRPRPRRTCIAELH